MKIAQVVCRFKPYKGGISNVAYDYALGLAKLGHQITVFTPLYHKADDKVLFDEFRVVRVKPWLKIGNAGLLPQLIKKLKGFDIINLHYPFFGGAEIVWMLKLRQKSKMKLVVNYQMDVLGKGWQKCIFKLHSKIIMPQIINAADKVIISSFDYIENSDIKNYYFKNKEKFIAIPPGVDLNKFYPLDKEQDLVKKFLIKPDEKVLLFVGGLDKAHYFKGLKFLIDCYKDFNLEKLKIIIVGEGDLRARFQKQVFDAGLIDQILFTGSILDTDLPKYYNLADAIILPSIDRSEAFGIVLIEAMACAKPVIAANLPGVRSVFEDGVEGLSFKLLDNKDLTDKVRKMFIDNDLRIKMGRAARTRVEKYFNQKELTKQLDSLYRNL